MEDADVLFSIFVPFISRKSDQHLFVLCRIELVEATKRQGLFYYTYIYHCFGLCNHSKFS